MSSTHPARPRSIGFSSLLAELYAIDPIVAAFARSRGLAPWRQYHALNRLSFQINTGGTPARTYVTQIEEKIVLIDGAQLADLMIEHGVGVVRHQA